MTKLWWRLFFIGMVFFLFGLALINENNLGDHCFVLDFPGVLFFQSSGKFEFASLWLWVGLVEELEQA